MNILLMGAQGVGKGTYAAMLVKKYGLPAVAMGDLLRGIKNNPNHPLSKKIAEVIDKGNLVPTELTVEILKKRLAKKDCEKGFFLDGFPRDQEQAEALEKVVKVDKVIVFTAPREVIIKRLHGRRICRKCQAIFNVYYIKPKKEGVCDKCGGELYQREDDKDRKAIEKRLDIYEKETKPLIDFYREKNLVAEIPSPPIEKAGEVIGAVEKALSGTR